MATHSSTLAWESHGWRSMVGYSLWGLEEWDKTEQLHFHFSLSCTGEGNGNPLQYSCLENPRDGGAWWAAIYRVSQSGTRLTWLSSSSRVLDQEQIPSLSKFTLHFPFQLQVFSSPPLVYLCHLPRISSPLLKVQTCRFPQGPSQNSAFPTFFL